MSNYIPLFITDVITYALILKLVQLIFCYWKRPLDEIAQLLHAKFFIQSFIEAEWRIYTSLKQAIIGLDNGLSLGRRQAIIWTNAGILSTEPLGINVSLVEWCKQFLHTDTIQVVNPSLHKTRTCLFYIVNITGADGHQQQWYWLFWTGTIRSPRVKSQHIAASTMSQILVSQAERAISFVHPKFQRWHPFREYKPYFRNCSFSNNRLMQLGTRNVSLVPSVHQLGKIVLE